ncbi:MAG: divergent polysaccharide deacetylase family protein [Rhizomicrobium sp.]
MSLAVFLLALGFVGHCMIGAAVGQTLPPPVKATTMWIESVRWQAAPAVRLTMTASLKSPAPVMGQGARTRRTKAAVAIVMDDLGPDVTATRQAISLPPALTMSFLPYARDVAELARAAEARGHEVIVHVPMQPLGPENPGPMALRVNLSAAENQRRLSWDLSRVPGAVGINNHMGSRFTADRTALVPVLEQLSKTGDFFFDSRTTAHTVVVPLARAFGILSAGRDVFLDDIQRKRYVLDQLRLLKQVAVRNGVAIAIAHPHPATLQAIRWWLAHQRGLDLVTLHTALRLKTGKALHGTVTQTRRRD